MSVLNCRDEMRETMIAGLQPQLSYICATHNGEPMSRFVTAAAQESSTRPAGGSIAMRPAYTATPVTHGAAERPPDCLVVESTVAHT